MRLVACGLLLPVLLLAQGAPKPTDLVKQGVAAEQAGNWQEAAGLYGQALTINPKLGEANFLLGKLLVEHDSSAAGITRLEAAKTYKYDVFQVSRWLGLGYYRDSNYSSAIENYLVAVGKKPKLADIRVELANAYYRNGGDEEAMEQDSIALGLEVKSIEAQMVHGRLHARRREFDQARSIHDTHHVRGLGDDRQIVGDEKYAQPLCLQFLQEIEDLRLDGDVECGGRFVGDEKLGVAGKRHGDHDALLHAT